MAQEHDHFGNVIRNKKYSKPELIVYQHMGVGSLQHAEVQQGIVLQSMNKGYFESGVGLNNLIRVNYADIGYFGFGISAFYRYGPYKLPNSKDNQIFLWNFGFTF